MKEIFLGLLIGAMLGVLGCFLLGLEHRMDVLECMHGMEDAAVPPPPDGHYGYYSPVRPRQLLRMPYSNTQYVWPTEDPPETPEDEEPTVIIEDEDDVEIDVPSEPEPEV